MAMVRFLALTTYISLLLPSKEAVEPILPPIQWVKWGPFPGVKKPGLTLTTNPHQVLMLMVEVHLHSPINLQCVVLK